MAMHYLHSTLYVVLTCCIVNGLVDIPSHIPRKGKCPLEGIDECMKERIEFYRPYLTKGVPEMGIAPLEPTFVDRVAVNQGGGAAKVVATFIDLIVHGISNFTIKSIDFDASQYKYLSMEFDIPRMRVDCKYEIRGKILLLPIEGKGPASLEIDKLNAKVKFNFGIVRRNGNLHISTKKPEVFYTVEDVKINFNNLFNGQRLLGDTMNRFLNENWKELMESTRDDFEAIIQNVMRNSIERVLGSYPLTEIFDITEEEVMQKYPDVIPDV